MRILFFGLPGSGKTTLANEVVRQLKGSVVHLNADQIRKTFDDWDFTPEGRLRQAQRMRQMADDRLCHDFFPADYAVADFVAPLPEYRAAYKADFAVFMDTIQEGRFEDTNRIWVRPTKDEYRHIITTFRDIREEAAHVCSLIGKSRRA